ncbi:MFS transporter [Streptomyces sp. ME19-01-6]|uniref:MFS transporter n=1 Tax=Streptomyces sp. ME19-01-6 TaxID=3028686 RepID=UPI0029B46DF9|nr:MFS transporter [Streptomyces sp. ME19-01-6]MDX3225949.1 MFS transporter [Streptomyces sp. ME19-01-6]
MSAVPADPEVPDAPDALDPRRWWALGALVAALLVLGFDTTILNIALPQMATALGADTGEQQWIADSYTVVFAAGMLPAGLLGDRFGRRSMLVAGLGIFLVGSVVGTLVDSAALVVAARVIMGLGAALVSPLALAVVPTFFGPKERAKAIGALSAAAALGMPLGPLVGGWLLDHFWWGSVFLINIPMAAIAMAVCLFLLPETRDPAAPKVDPVSTALSAGGLSALVYGIIEAPHRGWSDPLICTALAASVALLAGLVLRERQAVRPMLDLPLLRRPAFLWSAVTATLVSFCLLGLLFVLPQYLQAVLGYDAFGTGLRLLPMMGGLLVSARTAGPLAARLGARSVVAGGLLVIAAAAFLGSRTQVGDGYGMTALWLSLTGLGFGFGIVPAMDAALGSLPKDREGTGSGLLMTLRQVGGAIGIALLGSLLADAYDDRLDTTGLPPGAAEAAGDSVVAARLLAERLHSPELAASADRAFVHGMDLTLLITAAAALAAAALIARFMPGRGARDPRGGQDARDTQGAADTEAPAMAEERADARQ